MDSSFSDLNSNNKTPHIDSNNTTLAVNCFNYETLDFLNHVLDYSNSFLINSTLALDNIENTLSLLEMKLNSIETSECTNDPSSTPVQPNEPATIPPIVSLDSIPPPPPPPAL
ncbi:similar to invapore x [Entamoeba histolytica]|uniref:Similar to invapore x n=1 Tax=Entamoeba histolytica TaxID=5759 RepID=A0A175JIT2_ENTHI|nr:similar to invapore x [Entamoeba histolytica]